MLMLITKGKKNVYGLFGANKFQIGRDGAGGSKPVCASCCVLESDFSQLGLTLEG
jgi:hypothetical protein